MSSNVVFALVLVFLLISLGADLPSLVSKILSEAVSGIKRVSPPNSTAEEIMNRTENYIVPAIEPAGSIDDALS